LLVHAAAVSLAIAATMSSGVVGHQQDRDVGEIVFVADPTPPAPSTAPLDVPDAGVSISFPNTIPATIPPVDLGTPWDSTVFNRYRTGVESSVLGTTEPGEPGAGTPVAEANVDEKPELISAAPPAYPDLLRQAGIEGTVVIQATIDTGGRVEVASLRVLRSDNPAFESAAREAILRAVYRPARIRGRAVRVLVQVPITFTIRR